MAHIENNLEKFLAEKIGMTRQERRRFIDRVLGSKGLLANATDHTEQRDALEIFAYTKIQTNPCLEGDPPAC